MIPVSDEDIRGASPPIVTWLLIIVNVLVFVYQLTLSRSALIEFAQVFGVVPAEIQQGRQLYSLLTAAFLHGGWMHLIGNMLFLGVFGDNVEAVLGKLRYLLFYLAGGLAASIAFVVINLGGTTPSLGASGAVAAIMGAYIVMFPKSEVRALVFLGFFITVTRIAAVVFLGVWFVLQLLSGIGTLGLQEAAGGVAYWAHIGGFVFGMLIGLMHLSKAKRAKRQGL